MDGVKGDRPQLVRVDLAILVQHGLASAHIDDLAHQTAALWVIAHQAALHRHTNSPLMFMHPATQKPYLPQMVRRLHNEIIEEAGLDHIRFADLQHTFFTMALFSGVDVKTLSSMLGHYSAGFTLDTYTHITDDMQRGAAEKIGGFVETATAKPEPEPPDLPEDSRCKVISFERVG